MNKGTPQWNHNSGIIWHAPDLVPHWKLIDPISLSPFSQGHWCYNNKTTEPISFMLRKTLVITLKKKTKNNRTSYPSSHTIIEDTTKHNIPQKGIQSHYVYIYVFIYIYIYIYLFAYIYILYIYYIYYIYIYILYYIYIYIHICIYIYIYVYI